MTDLKELFDERLPTLAKIIEEVSFSAITEFVKATSVEDFEKLKKEYE